MYVVFAVELDENRRENFVRNNSDKIKFFLKCIYINFNRNPANQTKFLNVGKGRKIGKNLF